MRELLLGKLRIAPALMLAPMEGVTDPCFRDLLLETCGPGAIGAACTEFHRVTDHPIAAARIRAETESHRWPQTALGVQLMGNRAAVVAASAAIAADEGASFVDLNFGCPAPRVFSHCAGSALLADPPRLEAIVRATVRAVEGRVPVTAKIRAGLSDDRGLEDIARRVEDAGASALTVHARLRIERYEVEARWERITRAKAAVRIPVIGNGSADSVEAVDRMFAETGCDAVMIGRGALANPWIFLAWKRAQAGEFHREFEAPERWEWIAGYAVRMQERGATASQALGRAKQALKAAAAARLVPSEPVPLALRARCMEELLALAVPAT